MAMFTAITPEGNKKKESLPVNFQGASYYSDNGETEYDSRISQSPISVKTLRTGLLNCLNARSRGLTFRAPCVLHIGTGVSLLSRERFLYI